MNILLKTENRSCTPGKGVLYYVSHRGRKERDTRMMTDWIKGDLDDMIYADCDCRASDR